MARNVKRPRSEPNVGKSTRSSAVEDRPVAAAGRVTEPFTEVRAVEKLVGPAGLRSLPWFALCRDLIASGRASAELLEAARKSREEWERVRDSVPTYDECVAARGPARVIPLAAHTNTRGR